MVETFLTSSFAVNFIYPFLLVFTIVFAILEKTKILGDGKKQIDAIVSLVIGLIVISFAYATGIIVNLMPFLAVVLIIIFVFMIIFGFVSADEHGFVMNKGLKITFGVLGGLALLIAVIIFSGQWGTVYGALFNQEWSGNLWANILLLAVVIGAITIVLSTGKNNSGSSGTRS